nr:tetraspanin-21-like [Onthophagus taurus]XP_022917496.1 tetraspanin-21-like [Onthophagus taurus]
MDSNNKLRIFMLCYAIYGILLVILGVSLPKLTNSSTDKMKGAANTIKYIDGSSAVINTTTYIFLAYGIMVLILTAFIYKCLLIENKKLLKWLRILLVIAITIKIGTGSILSTHILKQKFAPAIRSKLINNFIEIPFHSSKHFKAQMFFEEKYDCCGVDNYTDYNVIFESNDLHYPESCCTKYNNFCTLKDEIKPDGCFDKLLIGFHTSFVPLLVAIVVGSVIETTIGGEIKMIIEKVNKIPGGNNLQGVTQIESTAV